MLANIDIIVIGTPDTGKASGGAVTMSMFDGTAPALSIDPVSGTLTATLAGQTVGTLTRGDDGALTGSDSLGSTLVAQPSCIWSVNMSPADVYEEHMIILGPFVDRCDQHLSDGRRPSGAREPLREWVLDYGEDRRS